MARIQRLPLLITLAFGAALAVGPLRADEGPRLGQWSLTGTGNTGVGWSATFELKQANEKYSGTFAWSMEGSDAGTESFQGAYNSARREIILRGVSAKGNVEAGRYVAAVSADRTKMTGGKWTGTSDGTEAEPGTWEAVWTGDDKPEYQKKVYADGKNRRLPYRLLEPFGYDKKKTYPLVLFLHGAGERGTDNEKQLWAARDLATPRPRKDYPCFVAAPQCPGSSVLEYWNATVDSGLVMGLIKELESQYSIDSKRIYITGLSDGGWGVFALLAKYPNRFAAAVPICGGGEPDTAAKFARTPIWVFHGAKDQVEPVKSSRALVAALKQAGGSPKYTEYPNRGHNSWDPAYRDPKLFEWMFSQKRE